MPAHKHQFSDFRWSSNHMAGLKFDDFFPRVIDSKTHSIIDYIHAGTNFAAGANFLKRDKRAAAAAFALGGSVLLNALDDRL
jgi:hypothetical protein